MKIRRACKKDIEAINRLLIQVLNIHHEARADIFKGNAKKYTDRELFSLFENDEKPIFVAEEESEVLGYAFCQFVRHEKSNILTDVKTLYIDDLCVDENSRGKHIGTALYDFVKAYAKEQGCYNVTLNVWQKNQNALKFYEKMGLKPQRIIMEELL